jgi:hypothetical protein
MPLIRGHHSFDDHFTQIPNAWLRDPRISLQAKGLLAQLLSHNPGWKISQESLAKANGIGRDGMRSILTELTEAGYLSRSEDRLRNESGQLAGYQYTTKDPQVSEPVLAEPTLANTTHKNNIDKNNIFKNKERELFDEFWNEYPKKVDKAQAFRQFKRALSRARFEDILAGAIRYASDPNLPEARFIKYPATWLNADAWENGPLPERSKSSKPKETDWEALDRWAKEQDERNV